MKLSIIICTFNRARQLEVCLASLLEQVEYFPDVEIVVVDNNSKDDTSSVVGKWIEQFPGKLRYVFEKVQGPSKARNTGVQHALGSIVAFIDDDAIAREKWVSIVYEHFVSAESHCLTGRIVVKAVGDRPDWFTEALNWVLAETNYGSRVRELQFPEGLPGGHMAIRKDIYEAIGGFNENLPIYYEEGEFFYRLSMHGYRTIYNPELVIDHCPSIERLTQERILALAAAKGRGFANTYMLYKPTTKARFWMIVKYLVRLMRLMVSIALRPSFERRFTLKLYQGWLEGLYQGPVK